MTIEEAVLEAMQQVREGLKPTFIGLPLTQEQFDELVPYVKDRAYIENVLLMRGWRLLFQA